MLHCSHLADNLEVRHSVCPAPAQRLRSKAMGRITHVLIHPTDGMYRTKWDIHITSLCDKVLGSYVTEEVEESDIEDEFKKETTLSRHTRADDHKTPQTL